MRKQIRDGYLPVRSPIPLQESHIDAWLTVTGFVQAEPGYPRTTVVLPLNRPVIATAELHPAAVTAPVGPPGCRAHRPVDRITRRLLRPDPSGQFVANARLTGAGLGGKVVAP